MCTYVCVNIYYMCVHILSNSIKLYFGMITSTEGRQMKGFEGAELLLFCVCVYFCCMYCLGSNIMPHMAECPHCVELDFSF